MKYRCIHCGQFSEGDEPAAQQFTCPSCGKNSWIEEAQTARRFRLRDFAIAAMAILALCALVFLFFRPDQPLHRLVFGDLRSLSNQSPTNSAVVTPTTAVPNFAANRGSGSVGTVGVPRDSGVIIDPATGTPISQSGVEQAGSSVSAPAGVSGGVGVSAPDAPENSSRTPINPSRSVTGATQQELSSAPNPGQTPAPNQGASRASPAANPGRPAIATSTPQAAGSTVTDATPASTRPDQVAREGTDELLQLKKDHSAQQKAADSNSDSPTTRIAGLATTTSKAGQGAPPTSTSGIVAEDSERALAGKGTDESRTRVERPFGRESGSNVIYVLDHSLSMKGEKSNAARHELVRMLEKLAPDKSFYVILFPEKPMPAAGPLLATPENIQMITNWIYSIGHSFGSDPTKAMLKALDSRPNTIWLLSDGRFSDEAASTIRLANENIHAQINTIGVCNQDGERVLKQIAEQNHGAYRFIPPPSRKPAGEFAPVADAQSTQE